MKYAYLSYIRILAILFVVFYHSYGPYGQWLWIKTEKNSSFDIINHLLEPFVAMMPLLTFISGYLFFLLLDQYQSYKSFIYKKVKRLVIPMLVFGLLYMFMYEPKLLININIANKLLSGYSILWYLNMLFWCFVIIFPISKNIKNIKIQLSILLISFALMYVKCPAILGLDILCRMFFYFYFGALFSEYVLKYKEFNSKLLILILGLLFLISYLIYELNMFDDFLNPKIKFISGNILRVSFILFVVLLFRKIVKGLEYNRFVKFLDQNSFGCYIFHYPIIYFLFKTEIVFIKNFQNNCLFPIVTFFIAVTIAYTLTSNLRKLKFARFLLG